MEHSKTTRVLGVLTALAAAVACVSDARAAEGHGRPGPRPWNSSATDAVPAKQGANIHGQALEAQLFAGFKEPTAKQSAARAALPQNVKQALTNLKAGKMSVEDRALLASNPEYTKLADALVQRVTTGKSSVEAKTNAALSVRGSAAATYCRGFSGWVDAKSWISGAWLYQWAQRLDVCYDGSAVTSLNSRYYTVGHRDWAWKDQGLLSDSPGSLGGWQYQSYMRGHMEMCIIKFGCTTDQYPWVRIIAYGNGTASITSGK